MSIGNTIWEKTHPGQVRKEKEGMGYSKKTTPAGEDRDIDKESNHPRDRRLRQLEDEAVK